MGVAPQGGGGGVKKMALNPQDRGDKLGKGGGAREGGRG